MSSGANTAGRFVAPAGAAFLLHGVLCKQVWALPSIGDLSAALGAALLAAPLCVRAVHSLHGAHRRMDELVALAVIACFALADYVTAGVVALLMLAAAALETHTASGAWTAVESLLTLAPKKARRVRADGSWEELAAHELRAGDAVQILPGDTVPADGTIRDGYSALAEATITGESMPADKTAGDAVFAGTVNLTGAITVIVERAGEDTTLARVRHLIVEAKETRPRIAGVLERYAAWYPPVVVMVAALVLVLTDDWTRAISTIVAACPVALVIALPSATVAALAYAYRHGILVKRPRDLETAAEISAVIVDKTGTLTCGEPVVVRVEPCGGVDATRLVATVAAAARFSQHPVSRALVAHARDGGIAFGSATDVREEPGKGVSAVSDGVQVRIGRPEFLAAAGVDTAPLDGVLETLAGCSVLAVAFDGRAAGVCALEDRIRPEAHHAMEALRAGGVERIVMVTGDREDVALRTARDLGIDEVVAHCLPERKLALVAELRGEGHRVLVAGDGVNDAPALASGDLGVAVGTGGSAIALESADVALITSDLRGLGTLLRVGRRARAVGAQNLVIGIALIAAGVGLAAAGHLAPVSAAILQNAGALAVLLSSARLVSERSDGHRP